MGPTFRTVVKISAQSDENFLRYKPKQADGQTETGRKDAIKLLGPPPLSGGGKIVTFNTLESITSSKSRA